MASAMIHLLKNSEDLPMIQISTPSPEASDGFTWHIFYALTHVIADKSATVRCRTKNWTKLGSSYSEASKVFEAQIMVMQIHFVFSAGG